jgi:dihydroneopterin aldolase
MEESIIVSGIELLARIGVPEAERALPQRLTVSLRMMPARGLAGIGDHLANTVDYAAACETARREAEAKPRRLIETLAEDIAAALMAGFPLRAVEVEVRKYILPGVDYAAVRIRREAGARPLRSAPHGVSSPG